MVYQKWLDEFIMEKLSLASSPNASLAERMDLLIWMSRFGVFYNTRQLVVMWKFLKRSIDNPESNFAKVTHDNIGIATLMHMANLAKKG